MSSELSRRDFIKYCAATAALLGLSHSEVPRVAEALEDLRQGKTPLIWLAGQGCQGCQSSLLNSTEPSPAQLLLESFSIRFLPLLTAASGELSLTTINETAERAKGRYVLLVEGTIPVGEQAGFSTMGVAQNKRVPVETWLQNLAKNARATFAVGTCAAYGGIPVLGPTSPRAVEAVLQKPVTCVPGCPPHPDWIVGTLAKLLIGGDKALVNSLDADGRPREFFGELVHGNCPRRAAFDAGIFVGDFNDNVTADNACLLSKGCKGPVTHADCPKRRWNEGINWCIGAGAPCNGCTEPGFYGGFAPLFDMMPDVTLPFSRPMGVSADTMGGAIAGATAIGIGAHLVYQVATGKLGLEKAGSERPPRQEPDAESEARKEDTGLKPTHSSSIRGFYGPRRKARETGEGDSAAAQSEPSQPQIPGLSPEAKRPEEGESGESGEG